jgi:hypothetical protein
MMDQIVRLNRQREAILEDAADRFITQHHGNLRKALKEMIVLNAHLCDQLEEMAKAKSGAIAERSLKPEQIQRRFWF